MISQPQSYCALVMNVPQSSLDPTVINVDPSLKGTLRRNYDPSRQCRWPGARLRKDSRFCLGSMTVLPRLELFPQCKVWFCRPDNSSRFEGLCLAWAAIDWHLSPRLLDWGHGDMGSLWGDLSGLGSLDLTSSWKAAAAANEELYALRAKFETPSCLGTSLMSRFRQTR